MLKKKYQSRIVQVIPGMYVHSAAKESKRKLRIRSTGTNDEYAVLIHLVNFKKSKAATTIQYKFMSINLKRTFASRPRHRSIIRIFPP